LAYKRVKSDHKDIHSGKFDNSPGVTVVESREVVNTDRNVTCGKGLHFCSWEYLSHFGSSSANTDRVVIVEIDPSDIVSIPSDYNNTKARCCKYTVLYDYGKPWGEINTNELKAELTGKVAVKQEVKEAVEEAVKPSALDVKASKSEYVNKVVAEEGTDLTIQLHPKPFVPPKPANFPVSPDFSGTEVLLVDNGIIPAWLKRLAIKDRIGKEFTAFWISSSFKDVNPRKYKFTFKSAVPKVSMTFKIERV